MKPLSLFFLTLQVFIVSSQNECRGQSDAWQLTNLAYRGLINTIATNSRGYIFAGTETEGVYLSTDDGETWIQVNNGLTHNRAYYIATSPKGNLFASINGLVHKSSNNGDEWVHLNLGLNIAFVRVIAINSAGHVFAGGSSPSGDGAMCRSTDDGATWETIIK